MRQCTLTPRWCVRLGHYDHSLPNFRFLHAFQGERNALPSLRCSHKSSCEVFSNYNRKSGDLVLPLPMHALDCSDAIIAIGVWSKEDSVSGFYHPRIYDTIYNSTHIGNGPSVDDRDLGCSARTLVLFRKILLTSRGWSVANLVVSCSLEGKRLRNVRSCGVKIWSAS